MRKFNGTENEFELEGVTYIVKPSGNCRGCAFDPDLNCGDLKRPPCRSFDRAEGAGVIFIRKPATSESQPAMTPAPTPAALSAPASTTAKPLDFSRPVQTRNGRPVRILCTDRKNDSFPVVGLWLNDYGVEVLDSWTARGKNTAHDAPHHLDLIQAPQPRKHAELIKKWADDDSVRVKRMSHSGWIEDHYPIFRTDVQYEEILPSDPLY